LALPFHLAALQGPGRRAAAAAEDAQQIVLEQVVGVLGQAAPGDVRGGGVQAHVLDRHPARSQGRILGQVAHANRNVEAFG
nr:hypothetical protein [Tanacetum cinerariifolium]